MKITLLGDSIRLGYGTKVPQLLGEAYEVYQPEDNCRFAKYTLRMLFDLAGEMQGSEIVHWNNGMWDICGLYEDGKPFSSEEEYVENMLRIADILLSRYKTVIFATTTPVRDGNPYNRNSVIEQFNNALIPKLKEKGIIINDLYALVSADVEKYVREDDKLHLTDAGIEVCARQVANVILEASKR